MTGLFVPFCPIPARYVKSASMLFSGTARFLSGAFPYLDIDLKQSGIPLKKNEYVSIVIFLFLFYAVFFSVLLTILGMRLFPGKEVFLGPTIGVVVGLMIGLQVSLYPKMLVRRKVRSIEKNLVFALRTIQVQVKSGVPLFDAIGFVSQQEHGELSRAFRKAMDLIETGEFEEAVLQEMAMNNPSPHFRRVVWQLVNGLKTGSDVGIVLKELVDSVSREQKIQIERYGASLRILSLIYMMIGVILPAMGITLLIVLASFPQIKIVSELFWVLLGVMVVAEMMYIGLMKSKRPNIME